MADRHYLSLSFETESGEEIALDIEASLISTRPAVYGAPAEPEEVEIHAIALTSGGDVPSWIEAQLERSDGFLEDLREKLHEAIQERAEAKADADLAFF